MDAKLQADVGQLLWVGFHGTTVPSQLAERLRQGLVGSVILFRRNLPMTEIEGASVIDMDALVNLTSAVRAASQGDALISIDQEGGRVQRVREPATVWPPMLRMAAHSASDISLRVGYALGSELAALGIDVNFAPVLDVHTNESNPIIGDRAFDTEASAAATAALSFAQGLASAGVIGCGKHFPGHGDTHLDSHLALPIIDHDEARLRAVELVPFQRAVAAKLPLLMTAHVIVHAFDDQRPATMSGRILRDLLRGELKYEGLVVSDDLEMKAVADRYSVADAAVAAVRAGCDAVLVCAQESAQLEAFEALVRSAEADDGFRDCITEASARVRALKSNHATWWRGRSRPTLDIVGCQSHRDLAMRLAAEQNRV